MNVEMNEECFKNYIYQVDWIRIRWSNSGPLNNRPCFNAGVYIMQNRYQGRPGRGYMLEEKLKVRAKKRERNNLEKEKIVFKLGKNLQNAFAASFISGKGPFSNLKGGGNV